MKRRNINRLILLNYPIVKTLLEDGKIAFFTSIVYTFVKEFKQPTGEGEQINFWIFPYLTF